MTVNYAFIEKYQVLLAKDPNSKVFAPLGEAYRKLGLLKEALEVCEKGVQKHPHFVSGHVALANIFIELDELDKALNHLSLAIELSPENILAHSLCADIYLKKKNPKRALKSYKMVLFLNPQHTKALQAIKKLESITADEFEDDVFSMQPISHSTALLKPESSEPTEAGLKSSASDITLERYLSLIDALLSRNDLEKASFHLTRAERELGLSPGITKRKQLIHKYEISKEQELSTLVPLPLERAPKNEKKVKMLESLLKKINSNEKLNL